MKKLIKTLSILMVVAMLLCFFSSCSSVPASFGTAEKDGKSYDLDAKFYIYSAYTMHMNLEYYASMYGVDVSAFLQTPEGSSVDYAANYNDSVKDEALSVFLSSQKFSDMGLSLSNDDISTVNTQYDSMVSSMGETAIRKLRAKLKLSETQFKEFLSEVYKQNIVFDKLFSKGGENEITDEAIKKVLNEEYYYVRHILIKYPTDSKDNTISSTEDQSEENIKLFNDAKAKAEDILAKVKAGEDFITLAKDNTEDTVSETEGFTYNSGFLVEPYGYIFTENTMDTKFYDKAKEMTVGTFDIVETSYGWHIMQKLDVSTVEKAFELLKDDIFSNISSKKRSELLSEWGKEYTVTYNDSVLKKYSMDKLSNILS